MRQRLNGIFCEIRVVEVRSSEDEAFGNAACGTYCCSLTAMEALQIVPGHGSPGQMNMMQPTRVPQTRLSFSALCCRYVLIWKSAPGSSLMAL